MTKQSFISSIKIICKNAKIIPNPSFGGGGGGRNGETTRFKYYKKWEATKQKLLHVQQVLLYQPAFGYHGGKCTYSLDKYN